MKVLHWILNTDRRARADSRQFGILFGLICLWCLALAVAEVFGGSGRILAAAFSLLAMQALLITARSSRERVAFTTIGLLLFLNPLVPMPGFLALVTGVIFGILLLFIPVRLSAFVLEQEQVDANTVFGALCAYLFMGLSFAVLYAVITRFDPEAIYTPEDSKPTFLTWTYFSFTTLTTLGYGDIAPRIHAARMLAVLEALIGQIYLVVVVARLVGSRIGPGPSGK